MRSFIRVLSIGLVASVAGVGPAAAEDAPMPAGAVVALRIDPRAAGSAEIADRLRADIAAALMASGQVRAVVNAATPPTRSSVVMTVTVIGYQPMAMRERAFFEGGMRRDRIAAEVAVTDAAGKPMMAFEAQADAKPLAGTSGQNDGRMLGQAVGMRDAMKKLARRIVNEAV